MQKKPIRQLIKFSNYSLCTTLPKEFIDTLNWKQGDSINFSMDLSKSNLILSKIDTPNSKPISLINSSPPIQQPPSPPIKNDLLPTKPEAITNIPTPPVTSDPPTNPTPPKHTFDRDDLEPILPL